MSDNNHVSIVRWWAVLGVGVAAALLVTWLARVAGVPLTTLLDIVAGAVALGWLVLLVAVPWNLYFAARRVTAQMATSGRRGIVISADDRSEASRIARRMLAFALGGHVVTALVTAAIAAVLGDVLGYYLAGLFLLSALIRPAFAYFSHLRERIGALSRESTLPRDDSATLRADLDALRETVKQLRAEIPQLHRNLTDDLRRTEAKLTAEVAHTRQMLTTDLARVQDAQVADRTAARERDDELTRRVDRMVRRVQDALDGLTDHEQLQAGLHALIRMIRADATP
jgi:hypothetical protein